MAALAGCSADIDPPQAALRSSLTRPLVDPASGRVEETPDTELAPTVAPPLGLSGPARDAAERLSGVIRRVGLSEAGRADGAVRQVSLRTLDAAELRAWLTDVDTYAGADRAAQLHADVSIAPTDAGPGWAPAEAEQRAALDDLAAGAAGPLRVRWNGRRRVPARIEGALAVHRGRDTAGAAADFVTTNDAALRRLLTADARDTWEPVTSGGDREVELESIVFARYRDGLRVLSNHLEVFVTRAAHPWGAGVVARVAVQWDREVEDGSAGPFLTEADAVALAEDALGRSLERHDARLFVRCTAPGGRALACRPMWEVVATGGTGMEMATDRRADHAQIHARTGEVLKTFRPRREAQGSVNVNGNWPYESSDIDRDFARSELRATYWGTTSSTDDLGAYDFTPYPSPVTVDLRTRDWPIIELRHHHIGGCSSFDLPRRRDLGTGFGVPEHTVSYDPEPFDGERTEALMFQWSVYLSRMIATDFADVAELASTIWFDANPGLNGNMRECDGINEVGTIGIDSGDDTSTASSALARDVFPEEYQLTVQWCSEQLGPGCAWTDDPETDFSGPWNEGMGIMIAGWFGQHELNSRGLGDTRTLMYQGPGVMGDVFLHDEEIEGWPTGPLGCAPVPGSYPCTPTEACWFDEDDAPSWAQDKPRCMLRAPAGMTQLQALAWCQAAFPAIPALLVDAQPYGASPTEDDVMICVHNNYSNSRVFGNLAAQLFHTAGYRDGLAAMWGADRDRPSGVDLTQGAVNFHLRFASTSGDYEVTDAFHSISTETFAWLDDTTDIRSHAEVIRTPRDQTLTFVNGGPTSQPLRFDSATDADSFLLFGDAGASYRLQGTTVGGDLCATAYDWTTGTLLGIASGCTDGMGSTGVDLTVPTPSGRRMVFRLNNVLGTNVTYSLQVSAVGDDYPSAHADFATAQPLRASDAAFPAEESGFMSSTTDLDFFRYDVPLGDTGALTFTLTTSSRFPPFLDVYTAVGTDQPSFWTVASGIGSVTVPSPSPGWRYYVVVRPRPGGTGNTYTIRATQAGCSPAWSCNETGTYNFPRFLASTVGAHHWNAIDQGDAGSTWPACRDGVSCDWYRVDLAAGERFTGTLSRVFDSLCALELAVLAPPEQGWWVGSDGSTAPIVTDVAGSMENRGAQLTFVARRAGTYRVRVRGTTTWNCPAYQLTATQGAQDADQPPPIH